MVDAAGLDKFDLVAISQGSPVAVAYAARNPDRVGKMVLINGFAAGWRHARDHDFVDSWQAMATLAKTGWGKNSPAFRQVFTSQFFPDATRSKRRGGTNSSRSPPATEYAYRTVHCSATSTSATCFRKCRSDDGSAFEGCPAHPVKSWPALAARIQSAEFVAR